MRTGQFVPSFTSQRDYIDLDLGTGGFSEPIVAMGSEARSPGENVQALIEAIEIIRAMWSGASAVHLSVVIDGAALEALRRIYMCRAD